MSLQFNSKMQLVSLLVYHSYIFSASWLSIKYRESRKVVTALFAIIMVHENYVVQLGLGQ